MAATYAHKDQAETGVIFELIARRYEYRSIAIAANQPFGAWNAIFPDPAMTLATIDRLVHHAIILEMNAESYRLKLLAPASPTPSSVNRHAKLTHLGGL